MSSDAEQFVAALRAGAWSKSDTLRRGLWLTLGVLLAYRVGTFIPVPGVNAGFMHELLDEHRHDALGLLDVFTGGAVRRFSLFTLSIVPYLTAVSLINSATPLVPHLARIKDLGLLGAQRLDRYAMCLAAVLALIVSYRTAVGLEGATNAAGPAVAHPGLLFRCSCMLTLVAGSMLLTWMGRLINDHGIGPGLVLVGTSGLFVNLPVAIGSLSAVGRAAGWPAYAAWGLLPGLVLVVALIVFVEQAQRRIPIDLPRREPGRRLYAGTSSALPIKANPAGMNPSVSATSILLTPATIAGVLAAFPALHDFITGPLGRGQPLYLLLYAIAVVVISFIAAAHSFDVRDVADGMKKTGEIVPGLRPGERTAAYIGQVRLRLVLPGACYILLVCLPLELLIGRFGLPDAFTGAAIVGMVTLLLQLAAQLNAVVIPLSYDSLTRRTRVRR